VSDVSWIHLSDVHCRPRNGWDFNPIVAALERDIKKVCTKHALNPDLIFVTGDLAHGQLAPSGPESLPDQYRMFHEFLERIRNGLARPVQKERVFVIPGNHDIDRGRATPALRDWLKRASNEEVADMFAAGGGDLPAIVARLWAYNDFIKNNYAHLLQDDLRQVYAAVVPVGGLKLGIGGFNSAWSCSGESREEKGKLRLGGDWQVLELNRRLEEADLRIALIHHPESWFPSGEMQSAFRLLRKHFHFCLHGHEHDVWIDPQSRGHICISAAACYDRAPPKQSGYNIAAVDGARTEVTVRFRQFDTSGKAWTSRPIGGVTDDEGVITINYADGVVVHPAHQTRSNHVTVAALHPDGAGGPSRQLDGVWVTSHSWTNAHGGLETLTDTVRLQTIGTEVHGEIISDSRHSYKVRGTIRDNTWFVGTWFSIVANNTYHGSFVLLIRPCGRKMAGKWLGVKAPSDITVGEWDWEKSPQPVVVVPGSQARAPVS